MKTLRRLYVKTTPWTDNEKAERERATQILNIPQTIQIKNDYRTLPEVLEHLELESDDDIAEHSLKTYVSEPGYHNIYLVLTEDEWYELGLRTSLYGQSRTVQGQVISYGRPGTVDYEILHRYKQIIRENFTESTLREWHELCHGLDELLGIPHDDTHYHFYGYARKYKGVPGKHRRWVRVPDPLAMWGDLPWHRLKSLEETYRKDLLADVLRRIIRILQARLAQPKPLVKPLRSWGMNVTQPYANYNPDIYRVTGHHIGVDHASPVGTEIYAPADGELTETGYSSALGYYTVYRYKKDRWLVSIHLQKRVKTGSYRAGQVIGVVGKSGIIRGIHSHIEVWTVDPKPRLVLPADFANKWREYTVDPLKVF